MQCKEGAVHFDTFSVEYAVLSTDFDCYMTIKIFYKCSKLKMVLPCEGL